MKTSIEMVEEFHEAYGAPVNYAPIEIDQLPICHMAAIDELENILASIKNVKFGDNRVVLRIKLLLEEFIEFYLATYKKDKVGVLDALTDIQYVLDGTYLALGLGKYKQAAIEEVHRSNMSKLGEDGKPIVRDDGKILKGPNYSKPDLAAVLSNDMP